MPNHFDEVFFFAGQLMTKRGVFSLGASALQFGSKAFCGRSRGREPEAVRARGLQPVTALTLQPKIVGISKEEIIRTAERVRSRFVLVGWRRTAGGSNSQRERLPPRFRRFRSIRDVWEQLLKRSGRAEAAAEKMYRKSLFAQGQRSGVQTSAGLSLQTIDS